MAKKSYKKIVNVFKGESNPFNMKINREKRCILGQKVKGTKGLRSISRAECNAKRKDAWKKMKVTSEKASKFLDKRKMDGSEDAGIERLVLERKKKLKKNIFNLNEESLTHKGMPLDVTKTFHDGQADSEDEDQLDASFVNQAHFGGFASESQTEPKSHKEILEDLIVESKKKKYEMKMQKEVNEDLTENLDKGWKDFLSVMGGMKSINAKPVVEKPDPYTLLTNQLKFEKRGTPASRTKTPEELEKEEKERIKKLEEEKLSRMNADVEQMPKNIKEDHISADGIYDDFEIEPITAEENVNHVSTDEEESEYSDSEESVDDEEETNDVEDEEMETEDQLKLPDNDGSDVNKKNFSVIPVTIGDFENHLGNFTSEMLSEAIEEILRPCLKAKSEKTLKKLSVFCDVLIEYALKHLHTDEGISGEIIPHLHTIAEISPSHTAEVFLKYLDQEHQLYLECKKSKKRNSFPRIECLLILKYCSVLYSVSDFRHPVVTPAIVFMCDILSSTYKVTFSNITSRLFVCAIILDCVSESKRFVPEAVCFLNQVLHLALPCSTRITSKEVKFKEIDLVLRKKSTSNDIGSLDLSKVDKSVLDDSKKLSVISHVISLLRKFANLYVHLPSYSEIFSETVSTCSQLPTSYYNNPLNDSILGLLLDINSRTTALRPLVYENVKPKPLKMFEPRFESKFDKKDDINKKFKLLKRVSQKIKKEEKGVLREIRRDAQMIAAEKLNEILASDAERKRKVKELYHDLATQEGEYKKMMKKKS